MGIFFIELHVEKNSTDPKRIVAVPDIVVDQFLD